MTPAICSSDWTSQGSTNVEPIDVGQRPDPPLDQALDRREAERRALVVQRLGDAPGDRVVVRDAEDQRLLAVEQAHRVSIVRTPVPVSLDIVRSRAAASTDRVRCARIVVLPADRPTYHRAVTRTASTDLSAALAGVRAFVARCRRRPDVPDKPIEGSPEALVELRRRGIPYRVVTNFSSAHRSTLAAAFGKATGLQVDGAEIITAASAAAAYTATHHPGAPLLVLAAPDARREWAGQEAPLPGRGGRSDRAGRRGRDR